jgi:hypothetical protein
MAVVEPSSRRRTFLYPLLLLGGIAAVVFVGSYIIDFTVAGRAVTGQLFDLDVETLQNTLGNMAQTVAAVLGIVITVVSIVVQLAATRYTPRIADMFFKDRTNLGVLAFFVIACIHAVWVSVSVTRGFVPRVSIIVTMGMVTASLLVMVPYFSYVFDFLDPDQVVGRIQQQAVDSATTATQRGHVAEHQARALVGVEQLSDIAVNAVSQKDKAIAAGAIDAIRDLLVTYAKRKSKLAEGWFAVGESVRKNPDFISLSADSLEDLGERRVWLEWKVLRQYQSIYNVALGEMPDINHLVAIDTRYVGEAAGERGDGEALGLAVKFFNTYLRATLNKRIVRTAYNVLHQYRQLAEHAMEHGHHKLVAEVAFYFRYYGQLAHGMDLAFVTETVGYDLASLCERAYQLGAESHDACLRHLLDLDKEAESAQQEKILRGVRKAQCKLASFYLLRDINGDKRGETFARRIFTDMSGEPPERLRSIRDELLNLQTKDFWEVIDRGTNFDYLDQNRKAQLKVFFSWFPSLNEEREQRP